MIKVMVVSILGMAITGAMAVLTIPMLFATPTHQFAGPALAGCVAAFTIFAISGFVIRKRLKSSGSDN